MFANKKPSNSEIIKHLVQVLQNPASINLTVDNQGRVLIQQIIDNSSSTIILTAGSIEQACRNNKADLVIDGDTITCLDQDPDIKTKNRKQPPDILYIHTTQGIWKQNKVVGMKALGRSLVQLSTSLQSPSISLGSPIVLIVDAKQAHLQGVNFFLVHKQWCSPFIPSEFILND
jgi:RNA:NAD 2'-phosphotransferase (TPT1/KptA family)